MHTKTKICPHCKKEKALKDFYSKRDNSGTSTYCKACTKIQTVSRQRALKKKAVDYKGGRCQLCGYNKYLGSLEFHHLDPKQKDFTVSKFKKYSFEYLKAELDKCILVCSNCHREIHGQLHPEVAEWIPSKSAVSEDTCLDSYQQPKRKSKIDWPSDEELKNLVWKYPRSHLSKVFKVSDVAISRYLKRRGIEQPPRGYWSRLRSKTPN